MAKADTRYRITAFDAQNFMRLSAVHIEPDGNLVRITGRNRQGKTSVLNAIWAAIEASSAKIAEPIQTGADEASITLSLGPDKPIVVTRTFTRGTDEKVGQVIQALTVSTPEGARFPKPQTMLTAFLGALAFDPLAFTQMKPEAQVEILRGFVPDFDFEISEGLDKRDFEARRDINRAAKDERARASAIMVDDGDLVDAAELPDLDKMTADLAAAGETNRKRDAEVAFRQQAKRDLEDRRAHSARLNGQIKDLQKELAENEADIAGHEEQQGEWGPLPVAVDTKELAAKISEARGRIEDVRRDREMAVRKRDHLAAAKAAEDQATALTEALDKRAAERSAAIAGAALPVSGLTFGTDGVRINGELFAQCSKAERLSTSVAIGAALNPKLGVMLIQDGSLLDEGSMDMLAKLATERDLQIWVERVSAGDEPGFLIEDGHLKEQP